MAFYILHNTFICQPNSHSGLARGGTYKAKSNNKNWSKEKSKTHQNNFENQRSQTNSPTNRSETTAIKEETKAKRNTVNEETETKQNLINEESEIKPNVFNGESEIKLNVFDEDIEVKKNPFNEETETKKNILNEKSETKQKFTYEESEIKPNMFNEESEINLNVFNEESEIDPNLVNATKKIILNEETETKQQVIKEESEIKQKIISKETETITLLDNTTDEEFVYESRNKVVRKDKRSAFDNNPVLKSEDDESDESEDLEEGTIKKIKQKDDLNADLGDNHNSEETFESSAEEGIIKTSQQQNVEVSLESFNTKENNNNEVKSKIEEECQNRLLKETTGTEADVKEIENISKKHALKDDIEDEHIGKTSDDEELIELGKKDKLQNKTDNGKTVDGNLLPNGEDEETIMSNLERKCEIQIKDKEENCFKQEMFEPIDNYLIEILNIDERKMIEIAEIEPRTKVTKGSHIFTGDLSKPDIDSKQPEKINLPFPKSKRTPAVELHTKHLQDEVSPQLTENKPIIHTVKQRVIEREYEKYKDMLIQNKDKNITFEEEFVAKLDVIARSEGRSKNDNNIRGAIKESKRQNIDELNSLKLKGSDEMPTSLEEGQLYWIFLAVSWLPVLLLMSLAFSFFRIFSEIV